MDDKLMPNKAKAVDELRKKKLLEERQGRMLADMQKQATTPIIKDSSLSTQDLHHVKSSNAPIDTKQIAKLSSGSEFTDKIAKLRALKSAGKKALGILPFAGAGMAALSGDPAMAAEELASDAAGPAGMAYDALKPDMAGNPEDDAMMMAESQAHKNYQASPAGKAAKLAKLKALMEQK